MLSEHFIAASSSPPNLTAANSALLKDAGILVHTFQPQFSLSSTFKKSAIGPSCLAVNSTHIFAAQANKAVVHVYSREKGNHESTIHFPSRIHSLVLVCDYTILALGGEDGSIFLWETCTGRLIVTPRSHLQPVNTLAVDLQSNFLLSGSLDSNIHVWSLLDLLSFPSVGNSFSVDEVEPRHVLSDHRAAVAAVVTGHSTTTADIAISAAKDQTAIVWNYRSGERLRTYLLPSIPLCLALDPADRAFYTGFEDGAVQFLSLYGDGIKSTSVNGQKESAPVQPSVSTVKYPPPSTSDAVMSQAGEDTANGDGNVGSTGDSAFCLALSYDSTTLLSGHSSGKINCWSTAGIGSFSATLAQYSGAPITNIRFLPPEGWLDIQPTSLRTTTVTKPAPHEPFSGSKSKLTGSYRFLVQQSSDTSELSSKNFDSFAVPDRQQISANSRPSEFETALASAIFSDGLMAVSAYEVANWDDLQKTEPVSFEGNEDFMSINVDANGEPGGDADSSGALNPESKEYMSEKIAHLEKHVAHLTGLIDVNMKHIDDLWEQNEKYRTEKERAARHRRKTEVWRTLKRDALRGLPPKPVPKDLMEADTEPDYEFDSGTTDADSDERSAATHELKSAQANKKNGDKEVLEGSDAEYEDEEMQDS